MSTGQPQKQPLFQNNKPSVDLLFKSPPQLTTKNPKVGYQCFAILRDEKGGWVLTLQFVLLSVLVLSPAISRHLASGCVGTGPVACNTHLLGLSSTSPHGVHLYLVYKYPHPFPWFQRCIMELFSIFFYLALL